MNTKQNQTLTAGFLAPELAISTGEGQLAVQEKVVRLLDSLYSDGYRHFITSVKQGFDLLAAEAVLMLKDKYQDPEIRLIVLTEPGSGADGYTNYYKLLYADILSKAVVSPLPEGCINSAVLSSCHTIATFYEPDSPEFRELERWAGEKGVNFVRL